MKQLFLLLALCGMVAVGCTEGGVDDDIDNGGNNTEQPGEDDDNTDNGGNNTEQPGEDDDDENKIPDDAYITLNKEVLTFVPDGESVEVRVYSNYEWTLTNNCDWVTASISGGEASEEGAAITLTADLTYDDREGTIIFSCGKAKKVLVVSQSFKEAIIADENNVFNVPAEGGNVIINYQTTVECEVIIPEEAKSWISLAPATRTLVSESATLTVAENTTYSERSAVVKVVKVGDNTLFAEYTINQVQNDAIIADENNTFNLNGCAQSINIAYQTNVECEVIIPEEAKSWISLAPATRALVNESATLNIADNNTGAERSAVVKVVAANNNELVAEYTITQAQRYYIEYTSTDGYTITPYSSDAFGVTIVRNEYIDGKGYIDFDAPITSIGNEAFKFCSRLTSITIPDSVTSIGGGAFFNCRSLTSVTIPDSVTEIGVQVFYGCDSLTSITIGNGVKSIGGSAFYKCTSLTSVTIGNGVTSIGNLAFERCTSLTSVTIPDSVTSIGSSAFRHCTSLTSVTIGNGVTEIGEQAFYNCSSLTSITIPDSVTSIGGSAFENCTSLTSITIPDSVTSIGDNAFSGCDSLTSVYITDIAAWCNISFGNYDSNPLRFAENLYLNNELVTDLIIPDSVTSIGDRAFYNYDLLASVTIPDSVTEIGDDAFYDCTSLTGVYITDIAAWCKISFVDSYTNPLRYAENLYLNNELVTDLIIPDGVTSIGDRAFRDCSSLTSVTIPDSVTSIGDYAFYSCDSLTSITIGNGVKSIDGSAFYKCTSLMDVYCKPTTPPAIYFYIHRDSYYYPIYHVGSFPFNSGMKIYVPRSSYEAYMQYSSYSDGQIAQNNWYEYESYIKPYDFE